ncbi:hypothetical protein PSYCIT7_007275 [Pseudomonas syringae Cit 7]|uniref:Uncharacterized protein n=1 Tax=Pseudomonas syringae Cit 7 TaxID=629264 RepID=A0A8T8M1V2_PSESX|nr:hypothetical protein [Pseudomonas syringae]QUP67423.1 hypothetical protein PSYCIT7_007275 [Pseudomonas syringae Cit 7]SDS02108.1 hypothetical protein SAMN05421724_0481 [Pseudomonas syringae]
MAKPTTIAEINALYSYKDEVPNGTNDGKLVSCGQHGDYNELETVYATKLKKCVDADDINHQDAIDILHSACKLVKNPRQRKDFYDHIDAKLKELID